MQLVSSAIRCLAWRFTPWADEFVNLYLKNVDSDYLEVRSLISSNLMLLDNVYVSRTQSLLHLTEAETPHNSGTRRTHPWLRWSQTAQMDPTSM